MRRLIIAAALIGGLSLVPLAPASAATRHYDCSKAGNANKTACKATATKTATKATPSHTTTETTSTTTTTRHYDCTKRGNANKAACRTAAKESPTGKSPGAVKRTTRTTTTMVDCAKWYNRMRATCRANTSSSPPRTTVAPAPKPAVIPAGSVNADARGATAQCKDRTYTHAKGHRGACSHHGGVAKWL